METATLTKKQLADLIAPPKRVIRRSTVQGSELLTEDQARVLTHTMMWGLSSYPVEKSGYRWRVRGMNGCGEFPTLFKTKREAIAAWDGYISMLIDYQAGRIPNPSLFGID